MKETFLLSKRSNKGYIAFSEIIFSLFCLKERALIQMLKILDMVPDLVGISGN